MRSETPGSPIPVTKREPAAETELETLPMFASRRAARAPLRPVAGWSRSGSDGAPTEAGIEPPSLPIPASGGRIGDSPSRTSVETIVSRALERAALSPSARPPQPPAASVTPEVGFDTAPPAAGSAHGGAKSEGDGASAPVDWGMVRAFRTQAADQLAAALGDRDGHTDADRRALGSSIVLSLLSEHAADALSRGLRVFTPGEQQRLADAVFDSLFGLGRLQPLVDNPDVENVEIFGCDNVVIELSDGRIEEAEPVADSDEELVDSLSFLASRSQSNERPFSPAHPELHLRLDDGSRLAAWAWTTPRPAAVIRRHRLRRVTLDDLTARGSMSSGVASFLSAAVRAKKSIVVSGPQGAGKTTLLRALCAELDPWERIGTVETEHELHLHELTEQHRRVIAWEARPGSGERGLDGRPAGEISVADITYGSWRANLSRLIVGEVRGHEVLSMFEAMQGGAGSMSTTHANSARAAVERLVTLSVKTGAPVDFAYRQVAEHIDLIVQVVVETSRQGEHLVKERFVTEVVALNAGERGLPAYTDVFLPGATGRAEPGTLPFELADLQRFGFDLASYAGAVSTKRRGPPVRRVDGATSEWST